ncbi:MAG: molybdopterin cofactor-binding domain-containing protein [Rhizobiaceae bacterium]
MTPELLSSLKPKRMQTSRRAFLIGSGLIGGTLVLGLGSTRASAADALPAFMTPQKVMSPFDVYLQIKPDGALHIMSSQFEMGQGVYNMIATLVAEEFDFDWSTMTISGVFGDVANYGNLKQGGAFQITGGSSSASSSFMRYRQAGAIARDMIVGAATEQWNVPADTIRIEKSRVISGDKSESIGAFVVAAATMPVPEVAELKPKKDWAYIGNKDARRFDTRALSTGQQQYIGDIKMDGLVSAVPVHPPQFKAKVKSFDAAKAKAVKGVIDVVSTPLGLAVVAENTWAAMKGREALTVEWDDSAAEKRSTSDIETEIRAALKAGGKVTAHTDGDVVAGLAAGTKTVEAQFEFPYLAHAAMEPLNAIARINADGTVEVWGGHQMPIVHAGVAAGTAGTTPDKVTLHVVHSGGGFGRRATTGGEVVAETVAAAKAVGRPVRLQYTREDDMRAGFYRPMFGHALKAAVDNDGNITGWQHHIAGGSLLRGTPFEGAIQNNVDNSMLEGAEKLPYAMKAQKIDITEINTGVPVLWWRAVGATHNAYAVEVFIDQLAEAAEKDPVEFRMNLLKDQPRFQAVLKLAAEKGNWGKPEAGRFQGVGLCKSFDTIVAHVAEVSVTDGVLKVEKVTVAVDCGIVINPDQAKSQVEGGVGYGLGAILKSRITLDKGRVVEGNFDGYEVLTMAEMPSVDVHFVESEEYPTGVGEPGLPSLGPAVANAYYAATKKRISVLPFNRPENA